MSKTFLAVASHWSEPGIRQYASTDRASAERKCAELVNDLISDWTAWSNSAGTIADELPTAAVNGDWQGPLAALQLARLVAYHCGEGEAYDALASFGDYHSFEFPDGPPELDDFTPELQRWVAGYVADDDTNAPDAKIGFPMVWIEEVETLDAPAEPVAGITLGDMLSVIGWADEHTSDWFDDEGLEAEDRAIAGEACNLVARVRAAVLAETAPAAPTIVVDVTGGIVQGAFADSTVHLIVVDFDTDGVDDEDIHLVEEPDGSMSKCTVGYLDVRVESDKVDRMIGLASEEKGNDDAS